MSRFVSLAALVGAAFAISCSGSARPAPGPVLLPTDIPVAGETPKSAPASAPASEPVIPDDTADETQPAGDPWAARTDLIEAPPVGKPARVELPRIQRFTLDDGLKVMIVESHDLPLVSFHLAIPAGFEDETADKRGVSGYVARMLTRGTQKMTADQIAEAMDFVGGSLNASSDYEATHVTCEALAKDAGACLTLLPDVVVNPTFPEAEMKPVADQKIILGLKQRHDNARPALAAAHFHTTPTCGAMITSAAAWRPSRTCRR